MTLIIWSILLMMFLLWANSKITQTNQSKSSDDTVARGPGSFIANLYSNKIFTTILIFSICFAFVYMNSKFNQNLAFSNIINSEKSVDIISEKSDYKVNNGPDNTIDLLAANQVKTQFSDVAGLKEAKDELQDIISFLRNPKEFQRLGAKSPKGLILYGPPGIGKTLLARAIAGESKVSFISVSGSQFDQEFVGVGAARVRQLFDLARRNSPSIIFIDEIDSVAFRRHSSSNTPWLAQTVNQLLSEMDGLQEDKNQGIVVIAASNRIDALDPAILRPGRFDRHIYLQLPTLNERQEILSRHINKIKSNPNLDIERLAKNTVGFSGAELANLVNEAAINATKLNKKDVTFEDFQVAKDRIVIGATRHSLIMSDKEKAITAYHEVGHALVGYFMPEHNPINKITITPRGPSLGHTSFEPKEDEYSLNKQQLKSMLASNFGGRVAEELIFGKEKITTGAESDLKQATAIAHNMVTRWGYSEAIGPMYHDKENKIIPQKIIEQEVRALIKENYELATKILSDNIDILHKIAKVLLEQETLSGDQFKQLIQQS